MGPHSQYVLGCEAALKRLVFGNFTEIRICTSPEEYEAAMRERNPSKEKVMLADDFGKALSYYRAKLPYESRFW